MANAKHVYLKRASLTAVVQPAYHAQDASELDSPWPDAHRLGGHDGSRAPSRSPLGPPCSLRFILAGSILAEGQIEAPLDAKRQRRGAWPDPRHTVIPKSRRAPEDERIAGLQ